MGAPLVHVIVREYSGEEGFSRALKERTHHFPTLSSCRMNDLQEITEPSPFKTIPPALSPFASPQISSPVPQQSFDEQTLVPPAVNAAGRAAVGSTSTGPRVSVNSSRKRGWPKKVMAAASSKCKSVLRRLLRFGSDYCRVVKWLKSEPERWRSRRSAV